MTESKNNDNTHNDDDPFSNWSDLIHKPVYSNGGPSWCSVQAKIERAQKIKGILNVLGIYDHTNDKMFTHC